MMIRQAAINDISAVYKIYTEIFLYEKEHTAYTVWQEGVYPIRETAEKAAAEGALYVMDQDGEICASIIIDKIQPEKYGSIKWKYTAEPETVLVIHLLCVSPSRSGQGIGKAMLLFAEELCKSMNCRTIRLDTGEQNIPAVYLYKKFGFELAEKASMAVGGKIAHKNHLFFEKSVNRRNRSNDTANDNK